MLSAFVESGFVLDDEESLFANECRDLCELFMRIFTFNEPGVERGFGPVRHDVCGLFADIAAANTADVQRWLWPQLRQFLSAAIWFRDSKFTLEFRVVHRHCVESALFQRAERIDVTVIAGNQHSPV